MARFVITGAPGTGKTTVIELLGPRFTTVAEPARRLIAEHAAATGEANLDGRPDLFIERLLTRSIRDFESVSDGDVVLFDRGIPDCVAYAAVMGIDDRPVAGRAAKFHYESPVFIAPPWEDIYTTDELRRATFDQVKEFDARLRIAYAELGYAMVDLPRVSAVARAQFVFDHIEAI